MKPTAKYIHLLFVATLLWPAGCVQSQWEPCTPKMNTTIHFSLMDKEDNDVFLATVYRVDLFLFDASGRLVTPQSEENLPGKKRLQLDPGTYSVVAWANATPLYTRFVTQAHTHWLDMSNNYVLTAMGTAEDGDPLYYAPTATERLLTITVPPQGQIETTAEFRHAHVKVEVTVEGYDHPSTHASTDPLRMELTEITSRYGFGMDPHGNRVSYIRHAHPIDPQKKIFNTLFHVPVFDHATPVKLLIAHENGHAIIPPISIRELLDNKIEIEKLTYLPIRVTFDDQLQVAISVDLPEWGEHMVKPNI